MLGTEARETLPWRRRPRWPLPGILQQWRVWPAILIIWGLGVLWGLFIAVGSPTWWERAAGAAIPLTSVALAVWFVVYLRRPEVDDRFDANAPWVTREVDGWRQDLARSGVVEIGRSRRRTAWTALLLLAMLGGSVALVLGVTGTFGRVIGVVCLLVFVPLGLLPQLEFITARGPALRVDGVGIRLARWHPLHVPWSELLGADVHITGSGTAVISQNTVVYVLPDWFAAYQAQRPYALRRVARIQTHYTEGSSFTVASPIAADPFPLALWLDEEIAARNPAFRSDDRSPG